MNKDIQKLLNKNLTIGMVWVDNKVCIMLNYNDTGNICGYFPKSPYMITNFKKFFIRVISEESSTEIFYDYENNKTISINDIINKIYDIENGEIEEPTLVYNK